MDKQPKPAKRPPQAGGLRREAERRLRSKKAAPLDDVADVDVRAMTHELQVHQIELEMQNEELRLAQGLAQEASEQYQNLFDFAPVGYFLWDREGRILELNLAGAALLGLDRSAAVRKRFGQFVTAEDRATFADFCRRVLLADTKQTCEVKILKNSEAGNYLIEGIAANDPDGNNTLCRAAVIDISQRKRDEEEREIAAEFLRLVNESRGTDDLIRAAARYFQQHSGCEAVGIRLKDGDDYPYCEVRGFPEEFIRLEDSLCVRDAAGRPIRDSAGYPICECMCGNVICGRFDPSKPFFTARGSFWTNCTTELLASTTDADRQARTRNRCNGEGYESVALIALSVGDNRLGLLQLNDRRKGRFTANRIALWERLAGYLAVAVAKSRAEETLRESRRENQFLANVLEQASQPFAVGYPDGRLGQFNKAFEQLTGYSAEELRQVDWAAVLTPPEWLPLERAKLEELHRTRQPARYEKEYIRKDGNRVPIELLVHLAEDDDGQPFYYTFLTDLTERKRAEEEIRSIAEFPQENPNPVLRIAGDGAVSYANRPALRLLDAMGWQTGEPLPEEMLRSVRRVLEEGETREFDLLCHAGRTYSFAVARSSRLGQVNLYARDITERKRAEAALRESEHRVRRKLQSVLSPEGDLGELDLADLIDVPALQSLMDDFSVVAGIPMAIIDVKGRVLVGVGWQDICTKFHRVHPVTCRHCLESDTQLSAGLAAGECRLYKCKNNLWDMATPIFVGGRHVGNIFTGQFFFQDETVDREFFRAQAQEYGFDEEQYLAALDRVPRLSRQTVDHGMAFFRKLADTLSQLGYSNVKLARLLAERDRLTTSLRESRSKLDAALASMTDAVFISDAEGQFIDFNDAFATFHRFSSKDECSKVFAEYPDILDVFLPEGTLAPLDMWAVPRALRGETATNIEYTLRRKDTGETWVGSYSFGPIRGSDGLIVGSVVVGRDITEKKRAEQRIRGSLAEKEVLLKEIHHRVKNNMQVISSLVALQAERLPDAAMREVLHDVTHRVRSMALVHEKLYQSDDMAKVEFAEYARSLLNYLWRAHGTTASGVRLALDLEPMSLSVNAAVPCGLILNELVSNALKHAFRDREASGRGGEVAVSLRSDAEGRVCLRVRDNGAGLPAGLDWRQADSLGLRLVQMLAGQLHATVEVVTSEGEGTEFQGIFGRGIP